MGLRLNWTLFDGFQTRRRVQQNQIAIDQAEIQLEQARNGARAGGRRRRSASLRERPPAARRPRRGPSTTAETAYRFAEARLAEGVASQVDVRVASQNLDLARLNYLQAVYDALVARSDYERATGTIEPAPLDPGRHATPTTASPDDARLRLGPASARLGPAAVAPTTPHAERLPPDCAPYVTSLPMSRLALLPLLALALAACSATDAPRPPSRGGRPTRAIPVEVVLADPDFFEDAIELTGNVERPTTRCSRPTCPGR